MKRGFIWLGVITTFVVVTMLATPWFLSRTFVKERVASQLSELTGKQVHLNGDGSVSLWPFMRVSYHDVTIGDGLAPADLPPLVQIEGLEASLSLTSAIWGDARLSQVTLIRPSFAVQVNSAGRDNWSVRKGPLADRLKLSKGTTPETLTIGTVRIVEGIANYIDTRNEITGKLTDLNGVISWPNIGSAGNVSISAVWRGEVAKLEAQIVSPFELLRGERTKVAVNFVSKPVSFSYDGELSVGNTNYANGKMAATFPSPRRLLEWTGQNIPAAAVIAETFVEGDVTAAKDTIEFQNATVRVGQHEGAGRLQLQKSEEGPLISGTLAFSTLWIPNPGSLALSSFDVTPTGKLDLSFLEGFGLDLRVSAESAKLEPFDASNLAAAAIIRDGNASFEIAEADALGGSMAGSISFSKGKGTGLFATDLSLEKVDLGQLTTLYGTNELGLQGSGNAQFRLRSAGTSAQGILVNLDGEGSIEGTTGSIRGIDFSELPDTASGRVEGPAFSRSGSTPYESLAIKFSIANGSAFFDGSSMTNAAQTVSLGGQLDIVKRSLALRGEITRAKLAGADSSSFFVGGTTSSPLFVLLPKSGPRPISNDQ